MGPVAGIGHSSGFNRRLFAPNGTLRIGGSALLSPGLVSGQVFSGRNISVVSGASVGCASCPQP